MTPEILARDYLRARRDRYVGDAVIFRWLRRGRKFPRTSYHLRFLLEERRFVLHVVTISSNKRAATRSIAAVTDPDRVAVFRDQLTAQQLADCTAAAIARGSR